MINTEMVRDYLKRSARCLEETQFALEKQDYAGVVRRSQEALEFSAKAMLRALAIEYPREHDVGDAILNESERLPPHIAAEANELASFSRNLLL